MKKVFALLSIVIILGSFKACSDMAPSIYDASEYYSQHAQDLSLVTNYLLALEDNTATISKFDGKVYVNMEYMIISDSKVRDALSSLHVDGCSYIQKEGKQVGFELWSNYQDVGCGLVYSETEIKRAEECIAEEFVTIISPIDATNWYYYISDYNQWRKNQKTIR